MAIFTSIVAPTDLSDGSASAVHVAAAIARDWGASLCVIHIYAVPERVYGVYPMLSSFGSSLPLQEAADAALEDWTSRLELYLKPDLIARAGAVAETILDEVATRNADLVVIGTHVHHLPSPIIGSTAQNHPRVARARPHGAAGDRRSRAREPSERA